jgi:molybdenum cofactor cytidylyltransferase
MSIVLNGDLRNGFVGVLLAGGQGSRFRASSGNTEADKLLAELPDGRMVAVAAATLLRQVLPIVIAVVRPGSDVLKKALEQAGCMVIESAQAQRGMGASLAAAAQYAMAYVRQSTPAVQVPRGCLVALGDMPWLSQASVQAVLHAGLEHSVAAPTFKGRRGHPVAFAWNLMPELAALDGDTGARALLARHGVHEVSCDDRGILCDVDTIADLAAGGRLPD